MKTTKTLFALAISLFAVALLTAFKESKPAAADELAQLTADWERAKAFTLDYVGAATDEVITFRPTPEMRTFGQQMLHIAEANYGIGSVATGKVTTVTFGSLEKSDQYNTKAALTKAVTESYDFVLAGLKEMKNEKMSESISLFKMDMTRSLALAKMFEHQTHHRGQSTVYLRLKGITPPNERLF